MPKFPSLLLYNGWSFNENAISSRLFLSLGKEIKISEKDRNALLKICNSKYPKIELKKFYYFNDRCYVMKEATWTQFRL